MRGKLIAIEGPDGSSKGTQAALLRSRLYAAGMPAELHHEPTSGDIGLLIKYLLTRGDLPPPRAMRMLFAADRAAHSERIAALLDSGVSIVCDRYDVSNVVSAWAERTGPTGLDDLEEVEWTAALDRGIVVPDLTIVLHAPLDVCLARIAARGRPDVYESRERQARIHEAYRCAASLVCRPVVDIDASGTPEEVAALVWAKVEPLFLQNQPPAAGETAEPCAPSESRAT